MTGTEDTVEGGPRHRRGEEHRLPAVVAVLTGIVLYAALPSRLVLGTRFVSARVRAVALRSR